MTILAPLAGKASHLLGAAGASPPAIALVPSNHVSVQRGLGAEMVVVQTVEVAPFLLVVGLEAAWALAPTTAMLHSRGVVPTRPRPAPKAHRPLPCFLARLEHSIQERWIHDHLSLEHWTLQRHGSAHWQLPAKGSP